MGLGCGTTYHLDKINGRGSEKDVSKEPKRSRPE